MNNATRRPQPVPLEYITATRLADGADCPWRLGFSRDSAVSSLSRSSATGALGSAAHEVMSKLGAAADFEAVWQHAVSHAQAALIRDCEPASPPSLENWPGWSLTKVRMCKTWERNTAWPTHGASGPAQGRLKEAQPPPLPWRERWLRHPHLGLAGRPDLVERVDGEVWLVDLRRALSKRAHTSPTLPAAVLLRLGEGGVGAVPHPRRRADDARGSPRLSGGRLRGSGRGHSRLVDVGKQK